jgi:hypothetical protein
VHVVHPVADEAGDDYAVFAASTRNVLLTEPLAAFFDYTTSEALRPVLVTETSARLSPFVSLAMRRCGGVWDVRDPSGSVYDGLSGYPIDAFADLWRYPRIDRDRSPAFAGWGASPGGVLMFDVFAHQRAEAATTIGELAVDVVDSLGGAPPDVWGLHEPLAQPWSALGVTELARRGMPVSQVLHARSPDGSFCDITAARTRRGVLEQAKGGVPIGPYPSDTSGLMRIAAGALSRVVDRFLPTIGFVSLAEFDDGVVQRASAKRPEVPLAVVIGARGVRDLGIDAELIARRHDVTFVGRKRLPSLIVRFSEPDVGLWAQAVAFAHDLGLDRVAAAAGYGRSN